MEGDVLSSEIGSEYSEGGIFYGRVCVISSIVVWDYSIIFFSFLKCNKWFCGWNWYFFFVNYIS